MNFLIPFCPGALNRNWRHSLHGWRGALCGVPPLPISIVGVPALVTRISFRYCGITGLVSKPDRSRLISPFFGKAVSREFQEHSRSANRLITSLWAVNAAPLDCYRGSDCSLSLAAPSCVGVRTRGSSRNYWCARPDCVRTGGSAGCPARWYPTSDTCRRHGEQCHRSERYRIGPVTPYSGFSITRGSSASATSPMEAPLLTFVTLALKSAA
jgi:hypothetical protein